jgi:hypothetical protein
MVEESAWTNEEEQMISAADNPKRCDYMSRTDIHPTVAGCERGKAEMMRR